MTDIETIIKKVYKGQNSSALFHDISDLVSSYRNKINNRKKLLSEKDVMLICYGDHLQSHGEKPLVTLLKFLDTHLGTTINSAHILPFYPYTSDDGFSVTDYTQVNPKLGEWEDIEAIAAKYEVMFDAVINHISSKSDWVEQYLAGDDSYTEFFIDLPPDTNLQEVTRPRTSPLLTPFMSGDGKKKHLWSTFSADQIDINYANPKVLLAILEVLLFYCSKGARLIRLDAIGFMWKEIGTSCIHLPETHLLIQLIRTVLEEAGAEALLVTETNVPHVENISYFGNGRNEAHMVYNFTLPPLLAYSILKQDVNEFVAWGKSLSLPSDEVCFFNFTGSHDGVGIRPITGILPDTEIEFLVQKALDHGGAVSYKSNPDGSESPYELNCVYFDLLSHPAEPTELRVQKLLLSQAVLLTMPGVPGMYINGILGSTNDLEGLDQLGYKRAINREKFDYEPLIAELNDPKSQKHVVFNRTKRLIEIRASEGCFHPQASFAFSKLSDTVLLIERQTDGRTIHAIFNLDEHSYELPAQYKSGWQRLIDPNEAGLAPFSFEWLLAVE